VIRAVAPDDTFTETKVEVDKMVDNVLRTIGSKNYESKGLAPKI
jgi:hypothetical protein